MKIPGMVYDVSSHVCGVPQETYAGHHHVC